MPWPTWCPGTAYPSVSRTSDAISRTSVECLRIQLYPRNCRGFHMADIHFHVWHYQRDSDGVIKSMERRPERYEKRRAANRALEMSVESTASPVRSSSALTAPSASPRPTGWYRATRWAAPWRWARSTSSTGRRPSGRSARWNSAWRTWRTTSRSIPTSWYVAQATSSKGQRPAFRLVAGCPLKPETILASGKRARRIHAEHPAFICAKEENWTNRTSTTHPGVLPTPGLQVSVPGRHRRKTCCPSRRPQQHRAGFGRLLPR